VDEGLPRIAADRARLLQVLSNLLDNAIKFTPEGGWIEVRAKRDPDGVRVEVADSGPGIPPELAPRIFDRFWRASHHERGAGLGLAIAKGLVEAHGGTIDVRSEPGCGATFRFTLREHVSRPAPALEPARSEAILVVDDDDGFRREVLETLDGAGYHAVAAADGLRGLELARELGRPRLILLDLMMPVMDGWELCAKLRDDPTLAAVPIVVVTSFDRTRDALSLNGANGYLRKPVCREELLEAIRLAVN
jgi:CheY-like chemotaxis protein/anti-sigma regulatory factor (Ser/Thr protein kinase)